MAAMLRPAELRRLDWRALLREFPRRPGAWRALATNLVPLAGVVLLGWSAGVATLAFYADALMTGAVLAAVLSTHAMAETVPHVRGASRLLGFLMLWGFVTFVLALPVFVAGMFALPFAGVSIEEGWSLLLADRTVQIGFVGLAVGHVATAAAWIVRGDRRRVRDELREGLGLMFFKVMVLAVLGANVGFAFLLLGWYGQLLLLAVIAAILTIAEVYRAEVLAAMGVDRRFHESCEAGSSPTDAGGANAAASEPAISRAAQRRKRKRRR